ncbi:MAG: hypothetical protein HN392_01240 [Anaerolineae bacterium]|jgi:hypothetical protein|nr:hypothetical protein [Anaerolineae bacterium]MBT7074000.1 hypothetical protein [Anaerolineae bacterium]MBT7781285.1 hypothetical protein [Anaerolineae bacterium]
MSLAPTSSDRILNIYLTLNRYPVLSSRIRARMRKRIFKEGIISRNDFNKKAQDNAILSQRREGLQDPFAEETSETWDLRLSRVRDALTDFYFSYNFPQDILNEIIDKILLERGILTSDLSEFDPDYSPQDVVIEKASTIENLPLEKRISLEPRLKDTKVVLIRKLISDQLAYINIAKKWFKISDLKKIRNRKIGRGKIGGKAAGMLLAARILKEVAPDEIKEHIRTPISYYLGSDVMYDLMENSGLMKWADQKYKTEEEIRAQHSILEEEFSHATFPDEIAEQLENLIEKAGKQPMIVRSSSLLEDNFGHSFAGKYESYFCPNQGTPEENLAYLTYGIARVYASALRAEPIIYRQRTGLIDYDERLAILIQFVEGEKVGDYFLPHGAGVAFSRNLYRWSADIRREDGFLRLVWGLGTRAVDQTGNDYPRLVALSRPLLRPADNIKSIQRYSQQYVDLISLKTNTLETLPVSEVINSRYPPLRYIAQNVEDGYLSALRTNIIDKDKLVITYDELLRRTDFAEQMKISLQLLEKHYKSPVDTEFSIKILDPRAIQPKVEITILQCRPQSHIKENKDIRLPAKIAKKKIVFSTKRMVPHGSVTEIRYVLFVPPEGYFSIESQVERNKLERAIGHLNAALDGEVYVAVGPGRWGTSSPDLGVHIGYGDIYNTRALIELSGEGVGTAPEPSFGTHFFQDLMEAEIYPLAIYLDDEDAIFNRKFFYETPNRLQDRINANENLLSSLKLIAVNDFRPNYHLTLVMDNEKGRAVAYLEKDEI